MAAEKNTKEYYWYALIFWTMLGAITVVVGLISHQTRARLTSAQVGSAPLPLNLLLMLSEDQKEFERRWIALEVPPAKIDELEKLAVQLNQYIVQKDRNYRPVWTTNRTQAERVREWADGLISAAAISGKEHPASILEAMDTAINLAGRIDQWAAQPIGENRPFISEKATQFAISGRSLPNPEEAKALINLLIETRDTPYLIIFFVKNPELLVISVVIFAGCLSRSVANLNSAIEDQNSVTVNFTNVLAAPLLGGAVALMLFIVLKAGFLVVGESRNGAGLANDANPFFLSLVGLVGGILSNQVLRKIADVGGKLGLGQDKNVQDTDVLPLFVDTTRLKADLDKMIFIRATGVTAAALERWLTGETPVPVEMQPALCVWTGVEMKYLFRESPPATASPPISEEKTAAAAVQAPTVPGASVAPAERAERA